MPARIYSLRDRGRVAPGLRADLVLVNGDPSRDISATRDIVSIWKRGVRLERAKAPAATAAAPAATTTGLVSDFDASTDLRAEFGSGWQTSTDSLMGGKSTATLTVVQGGAKKTRSALEVSGSVAGGVAYPWAGAMFFPGATPMAPVDLSKFKEIVFWARGDGGAHQVMVFAARLGNIPATQPFTPGTRVARVRPALVVLLEPRRLGPARRAILRRVEARAFSVHHRRGAVPVNTGPTAFAGQQTQQRPGDQESVFLCALGELRGEKLFDSNVSGILVQTLMR